MCSFISSINTLPVKALQSSNGLVPVSPHYRLVRDVFPDTTDPAHVTDTEPNSVANKYETITSAVTNVTTDKKETLKPVSEDGTALFKLLHRSRRSPSRSVFFFV